MMHTLCTIMVFCSTFRVRPTSVAWRHRAMRHRRPAVTAHLTSNNWPIRITRRNADDSADVNGAFLRQPISCVEITRQKGAHGFLRKSAQVCDRGVWRNPGDFFRRWFMRTKLKPRLNDIEVTHRRFLYGSTYYRRLVSCTHHLQTNNAQ